MHIDQVSWWNKIIHFNLCLNTLCTIHYFSICDQYSPATSAATSCTREPTLYNYKYPKCVVYLHEATADVRQATISVFPHSTYVCMFVCSHAYIYMLEIARIQTTDMARCWRSYYYLPVTYSFSLVQGQQFAT